MQPYHIPVLFHEALEALNIQPGGIYVDCTFGGGGHSKGILDKLNSNGKLIAFDQDEDAKQNLPADERLLFVPQNFRHLQKFLRLFKALPVDGVLADLGVSSFQFDTAERGFSTRFNGPLDMRMDKKQSRTAADILEQFSETQLHLLFQEYGEISNSRTLAKHIAQNRNRASFSSIEAFKNFIHPVVMGNPNKYLAQVFQALRMKVNDEMGALKEMLLQLNDVLKPGGRTAIITFHSIEDRMVKTFFKKGNFEEEIVNPFENTVTGNHFKLITKKPVTASAEEIKNNTRSRSAKLRAAEKI